MTATTSAGTGADALTGNVRVAVGSDKIAGLASEASPGAADLAVARKLIRAGMPVFVAKPNPAFDPAVRDRGDPRSKEFFLPSGWPDTECDIAALEKWEPGWAVCLVTGHGLDTVDVDTKNGAMIDEQVERLAALGVETLGRAETPSGGAHLYVLSTGTCTSSKTSVGVDFRGCGEDGSGAGFVYLPGTSRPKYRGLGYTWTAVPDLALIEELDVDEQHDAIATYLNGLGVTVRTDAANTSAMVRGEEVDEGAVPAQLRNLLSDVGPTWTKADGTTTEDRSGRFHYLVGECRRAGLTQGQTVTLLEPWCTSTGKFVGRVAIEVGRSWSKVTPTATDAVTIVENDPVLTDPDRWIDPKDGLLVADLANDITLDAPLRRDLGDGIWVYSGGVWRPDRSSWVRRSVTRRLGNRSRPAHTNAVQHYLLGRVPVLEPEPVPQYVNLRNGLLDWHTGQLLPHDPDVLSTVQLNTGWDPTATCPTVEAWLAEVLPADLLEPTEDGPGFIWELIGYLCMSGNPLHKAVLLLGSGRNGKGTLLRLVTALLGTENVSSVDLHSLVNNRFRAAQLLGKVANIAGDLDGSWLESTAVFKAITGGDRIPAERKYGQPFDFTPFAVPVYSANNVFGTPDTSDGYMSRWLVVPFPNTFLGQEDRSLDERIQKPDQLAGVLVRAVTGLQAVMARGNFTVPTSIREAFERFKDESDPIRGFLADVSRESRSGWVSRVEVWEVYELWAKDSGIKKPLSRAKFYTRLEAAGWIRKTRTGGNRGFGGRALTVHIIQGDYPSERRLISTQYHDDE